MRSLSFLEKYDLLENYSVAGTTIKVKCFFHQENTPSLIFNLERDSYHCFGCEAHGDLQDAIQYIEKCSKKKAFEIYCSLEDVDDIEISSESYSSSQDIEKAEEDSLEFSDRLRSPSGARLSYLLNERKLTKETIKKFNIKENPFDLWPITIPIYSNGKFKGICKRRMDNEFPKYRYNTGFKVKQTAALYIEQEGLPVFLTEGILDAISASQMGYPNVACSFGWSVSTKQLQILSKYDIISALDSDNVGEQGYRYLKEKFDGKVYKFNLCGFRDVNQMLTNNERKFKFSIYDLFRRNNI